MTKLSPESVIPESALDVIGLFERLIDASADEREAMLSAIDHDSVRARLRQMLKAQDTPDSLLDGPLFNRVGVLHVDLTGQTIGPFRLVEEVGRGGMGVVYRALQSEPVERTVAIKLLHGADPSFRARFELEQQSLVSLSHPNIATVHVAGVTPDGRPYLVMEWLDGRPLVDYCDEHVLNVAERVSLVIELADALGHCHERGIIHRDVKPGNVLVGHDATNSPKLKLIDFGVAKARRRDTDCVTAAGSMIGTPGYMSPEQIAGEPDIDVTTDVYAVGVVLYRLLTGTMPVPDLHKVSPVEGVRRLTEQPLEYAAQRLASLSNSERERIARQRATTPKALVRELTGELSWIANQAMQPDRRARYRSPQALVADLIAWQRGEAVTAAPPRLSYQMGKWLWKHRYIGGASAVGLIALVTATLVFYQQSSRLAEALATSDQALASAAAERAEAEEAIDLLVDTLGSADPHGVDAPATSDIDTLLAHAVQRAKESAPGSAQSARRVLVALAEVLGSRGDHHMAIELLLELDLETPLSPQGLLILGSNQILAEFYEEARRTFNRLDEAAILVPQTLADAARLRGYLHMTFDEAAEAEASYRQAYAYYSDNLGPDHPSTHGVLNDLGALFVRLGRWDEAESFLRQSLATGERTLPPDHPVIATRLANLSMALRRLGQTEEAVDTARRSLAIRRTTLGEGHLQSLRAQSILLNALEQLGDLEAASHVGEEMITLWQTYQEPDSYPHELSAHLTSVGAVALKRGDIDRALDLRRRAYEVPLDPNSRQHLIAAYNYASTLIRAGHPEPARRLFSKAATGFENLYGVHPLTGYALTGLARAEAETGRFTAAMEAVGRARTILAERHQPDHFRLAILDAVEALALLDRDPERAVALLQPAVLALDAAGPARAINADEARAWLARAVSRLDLAPTVEPPGRRND